MATILPQPQCVNKFSGSCFQFDDYDTMKVQERLGSTHASLYILLNDDMVKAASQIHYQQRYNQQVITTNTRIFTMFTACEQFITNQLFHCWRYYAIHHKFDAYIHIYETYNPFISCPCICVTCIYMYGHIGTWTHEWLSMNGQLVLYK